MGHDDDPTGGQFGFPPDPDDEPDESPSLWTGAEWLPDTWTHPEQMSPTRSVDRFRTTTAGMMLAGVGLGIRDLLETPRDEAPIEVEAPGAPPGGRRVEIELDEDDPAATTIIWRGPTDASAGPSGGASDDVATTDSPS